MTLKRLAVTNFRNLKAVDIELSAGLNVFYGDNGSGKTSLLESISILSLGRSFRSRKFKPMINHSADNYTVFGVVRSDKGVQIPIGVRRDLKGEVLIRKSGQVCSSAALLAEALPIRLINGHSFALLEGSPQLRRQFLDWLVFHVEHDFYLTWRNYEKCLKQRNSLLRRDKIDRLLLDTWDAELATLGECMVAMRRSTFEQLQYQFLQLLQEFDDINDVKLRYNSGWDDAATPMLEMLVSNRQRDSDLGYTFQGPHRSDIRILQGKNSALEVLSRGQQKVVISALLIAQGMVMRNVLARQCVYLIDDLPAELDSQFRQKLAHWLTQINSQICVTGIDSGAVIGAWSGVLSDKQIADRKVFHVKHGCITLV